MKKNKVGIIVEGILLLCLLSVFILFLFRNEFKNLLYVVLSLTLFSMAYNNHKIYKTKPMTISYIVVGILCLLYCVI